MVVACNAVYLKGWSECERDSWLDLKLYGVVKYVFYLKVRAKRWGVDERVCAHRVILIFPFRKLWGDHGLGWSVVGVESGESCVFISGILVPYVILKGSDDVLVLYVAVLGEA